VEESKIVEPVAALGEVVEGEPAEPSESESEPEPAAQAEPQPEVCAQCGATLSSTDIFCGECGFVRRGVGGRSRPRDTVVLDPFPWGKPLEPMTSATTSAVEPAESEPVAIEPSAEPMATVDLAEPAEPAEPVELVEPAEPVEAQEPAPEVDDDELTPTEAMAPESAAEPATPEFADEADFDETRIVDRDLRGERFVLQFSTGESISVAGTGLVGRNPLAEPGEYFDALVTISDPGKSVSKTHLEFGQDSGAFWIADRFSGNGTIVREPERQPKRCDAGKRYRVSRGTRVDIGEQFFIVS
jgi:hypothetical protein